MVLSLKAWKSRSLPGLPRTEHPLCDIQNKKPRASSRGFFCCADRGSRGAYAVGPATSVPVRQGARHRQRGFAVKRLPIALLLQGLPGVRALPRSRRCPRHRRRHGHLPDAAWGVRLTAGADAVRSLRFSNKVFRWYTDCCRTPIANTAFSARVPLVGLVHSFMSVEAQGLSGDEILGPPLCRIYERSATAPLPPNAPAAASLGVFVLRAARVLGWWWHGLGRPNPFFDDRTGAPLSLPRVLTPSERAAL